MSNPKCGVCAKTVYPMELVTAAGKSFHKFCFKCEKCKTTLNLKNFKAHDGKIWCTVHYPPAQTKITSFSNDKTADSGTFENEAAQSATDAGGAWGGGQADQGECTPLTPLHSLHAHSLTLSLPHRRQRAHVLPAGCWRCRRRLRPGRLYETPS